MTVLLIYKIFIRQIQLFFAQFYNNCYKSYIENIIK